MEGDGDERNEGDVVGVRLKVAETVGVRDTEPLKEEDADEDGDKDVDGVVLYDNELLTVDVTELVEVLLELNEAVPVCEGDGDAVIVTLTVGVTVAETVEVLLPL